MGQRLNDQRLDDSTENLSIDAGRSIALFVASLLDSLDASINSPNSHIIRPKRGAVVATHRKGIRHFQARSNSGKTYTVIEYQDITTVRDDINGTLRDAGGTKGYVLLDRRDVNQIGPDTFEIVLTGEIIRKV